MGLIDEIIGNVKDKASISKAALLSGNHTTASLRLTILKATTHTTDSPPSNHHIAAILSAGDGPRSTASILINSLMRRLHKTSSSHVALKCLLAIHLIIRRGSFILHDQLSVYPTTGGRNYLKLSDFRDTSSPATWEMSTWIRWYAKYLEQIISCSRTLGFFLFSYSCRLERDKARENVSSLLNNDLSREIDFLVNVLEEVSKCPDIFHLEGNKLLTEVMVQVVDDSFTTIDEILVRVEEFKERLGFMSFFDSIELVCALKRLDLCKDRVGSLITGLGSDRVDDLWRLVGEMKDRLGKGKGFKEEKMVVSWGRFKSARFEGRAVEPSGSVQFSSSRFAFGFTYSEHFS